MTSRTPRTGNQYSIHHGDYSAVICELGAKIRRFDFNSKEIFCPFGVNDLTPTCNGYVLALGQTVLKTVNTISTASTTALRSTNITRLRATTRTMDTPTTTCGSSNRSPTAP